MPAPIDSGFAAATPSDQEGLTTMTTMTLHDAARMADSAYNDMALAAIELADADVFELPVEPAALNLFRKARAKLDDIIPTVERLVAGRHAPAKPHLWVTPDPATDPVRCQTCGCSAGVEAAQPCEGRAL